MKRSACAVLGSVAVLAALLAGCSSSTSKSTGSGSASGSDIKIMVISTTSSTLLSYPESQPAVEQAAASTNAAGGINGHQIKVLTCNDKYDPNEAATCARSAVSQKVAAVLAPFSAQAKSITPILAAAKIPYLSSFPLTPDDFTSDIAFPGNGGALSSYVGLAVEAADVGCKNTGLLTYSDVVSSTGRIPFLKTAFQNKNATLTVSQVPSNTADYAPAIASLVSQNVDCVIIMASNTTTAQALTALKQNPHHIRVLEITNAVPANVLATLPASMTADMVLTADGYQPADTSVDEVKQFVMDMKGEKQAYLTPFAYLGWATSKFLFTQMSKISGNVTNASVLQALTTSGGGMLGVPATPQAAGISALPRLFNGQVLVYGVSGQKYVYKKAIDVLPFLK